MVNAHTESQQRFLFFLWWITTLTEHRQNLPIDYYFSCGGCAGRISVQIIHFCCGGCTDRISVQIFIFPVVDVHTEYQYILLFFFCGGCMTEFHYFFSWGGCTHRISVHITLFFLGWMHDRISLLFFLWWMHRQNLCTYFFSCGGRV